MRERRGKPQTGCRPRTGFSLVVMSEWSCYFKDRQGRILRTAEGWDSPEHAAMWGQLIMRAPEEFELEDPNGHLVSATEADIEAEFTVEHVADEQPA